MTSVWRNVLEPVVAEEREVTAAVALSTSALAIGASQLLLARMNWERLFSSANPPGAATPAIARDSLTRQAIRRKETRRRALRSGNAGFVHAVLGDRHGPFVRGPS